MLKSHLTLAHTLWRSLIKPGDTLVDATLGNGHDALVLAEALQGEGTLIGYDIQKQALVASREKLAGIEGVKVILHQKCHSLLAEKDLKLVAYNLGYLPGSDKSVTTRLSTTMESLKKAEELLLEGGAISLTLYPGHEEGARESEALLKYASSLSKRFWHVTWISWPNRLKGPSLLFLKKNIAY